METFTKNSLDPSLFQVEDVESDNACFYRSLSNGIAFINPHLNKSLDYLTTSNSKLKYYQEIDDFYASNDWGYNGNLQDTLARDLQQCSVDWIATRGDMRAPLPEDGPSISIGELITMVHGQTHSEYVENYQHFAGDLVIEEESDNEISILEDRWGGYPEQLALTEHLKIPIIVLSSQKYDQRLGKLITGRIYRNKPIKGVRFKVYQTSGLQYLARTNSPVLYLLWKKTKNGDHYMALYPKNPKKCLDCLQEFLR